MKLRVLGVDPGTLRVGYGLLESNGGVPRHVASGVLTAPAGWPAARRLGHLSRALREILVEQRPDCVALEQSFFGKNAHSLIRLGEARGMVIALAGEIGIEQCDYAPAMVKKTVTGRGGASKEQVARVLGAFVPDLRVAAGEALDRTDAIAVALCHLQRSAIARRLAAARALVPRRAERLCAAERDRLRAGP